MSPLKIIGYITAGILIFFGVLTIWGAFSAQGGGIAWIFVGLITVLIGFGIIFLVGRSRPVSTEGQNVTLKVDLPGNVNLDTLKCQSCGGVLSAENITLFAGAPMVSCPYCKTTYQLTEEPKW